VVGRELPILRPNGEDHRGAGGGGGNMGAKTSGTRFGGSLRRLTRTKMARLRRAVEQVMV